MDHVDRSADGWTELRVHGVAGTAPETVLEHRDVALVAGNAQAGFFRRVWQARSVSADGAGRRMEAYSWGGLTSGDNTRALWLLLLPFMLLNVAFFMVPRPGVRDPEQATGRAPNRRAHRLDAVGQAVLRLLALSFTATFALTTVVVVMDLVGWQCAAGGTGGDVCGTRWLGWLAWSGLDRPGRQLAVTALLPLAVIGLLWLLGNTTWQQLERVDVDQTVVGADVVTPLEDRALWSGRAAVRRLRAVHVTAGLAVPGIFAVAPLLGAARLGATRPWGVGVLVALLLLVGWMLVEAARPSIGRRERPCPPASMVGPVGPEPDVQAEPRTAEQAETRQRCAERRDRFRWFPVAALVLVAGALVVAATAPAGTRPVGDLPGLTATVYGMFAAQAVLLAAVAVVCRRLCPTRGTPPPGLESHFPATSLHEGGFPATRYGPITPPAWHGLALPGIAMIAWVLAGGFSAGVILRAAQTLGTPVASGRAAGTAHPLVVPAGYTWAAVAGLVLGIVTAVAALVVWRRLRRSSPTMLDEVDAAYGPVARDDDERRDAIARAWAAATFLSGRVQGAVGFLLVVAAAVVVLGAVGLLWIGPDLIMDAPWLVHLANLAISGFVLGLVAVGRRAYRSPALRRSVGIVWDLGTFWPRAVHPLAPPCYAERAIPDLIGRLQYYTGPDAGRVLLSCHSQGTVLGAAVLLQVETAVSARTAFLTYGSPLARLYGGFFPAYVDARALDRLGGFLRTGPADDPEPERDPEPDRDRAPDRGAGDRASWRWRNLYRPSDPIGGPLFRARPPVFPDDTRPDADPGDVDRPLVDPGFARPPGDPCHPPILGHSRYLADPVLGWTTTALRDGVLPRPPDGG